ncbi:MAG TPA: pitrilysin family protein [Syntrophorhabdaceae bacterium]|jgi:zinc protease
MFSGLRHTFFYFLILFSLSLVPYAGAAPGRSSSFQRFVLPNGLVVLVAEDHSLPFVSARLLIDAGSRNDPAGEEGVARLTAKVLLMGTSSRSATRISEELDFTGSSLTSATNKDFASFNLRCLKKDFDHGLGLLFESLTDPLFPDDEVTHEKEKTLSALESASDRPGLVAAHEFTRAVFLKTPYSRPVEGSCMTVAKITRPQLLAFHHAYYGPNNAILAVAGDVTVAEVKAGLIPRVEKWRPGKAPRVPARDHYGKGPRMLKVARSISQAHVIIGYEGISRDNPDYYAAMVMNYILGGGGFSSRLMENIRTKRGLAYSVSCGFDSGKLPGSFQISLQTKNASARDAIDLAIQEITKMQKELVSEEELREAKSYFIGSFPMLLDTQGELAQFLMVAEFYGLGLDYPQKYPSLINAVTREDIQRVAKKYLHPHDPIIVVVANLKEAGLE